MGYVNSTSVTCSVASHLRTKTAPKSLSTESSELQETIVAASLFCSLSPRPLSLFATFQHQFSPFSLGKWAASYTPTTVPFAVEWTARCSGKFSAPSLIFCKSQGIKIIIFWSITRLFQLSIQLLPLRPVLLRVSSCFPPSVRMPIKSVAHFHRRFPDRPSVVPWQALPVSVQPNRLSVTPSNSRAVVMLDHENHDPIDEVWIRVVICCWLLSTVFVHVSTLFQLSPYRFLI